MLFVSYIYLIVNSINIQQVKSLNANSCQNLPCNCEIENNKYKINCNNDSFKLLLSDSNHITNSDIIDIKCNFCQLNQFPNKLFTIAPKVESIDFSFNHIVNINNVIGSTYLKYLNISNNIIKTVNLTDVTVKYPNLLTLVLNNNSINQIIPPNINGYLNSLIIYGNTINCSDSINYPFLKFASDKKNLKIFSSQIEPRCSLIEPYYNYSFIFAYEIIKSDVCKICDCVLYRENVGFKINCSNRGLTELPIQLPNPTKIVDLKNNSIRSLSITSATWNTVVFLYLSNNTIESLDGLEGSNVLKNVRHLDLHSNRLSQVPAHVLKQLQMDEVRLSGNPWRCDCGTIPFQLWIQEQGNKILDLDKIKCSGSSSNLAVNGLSAHSNNYNPNLANKVIYTMKSFDLCPQPSGRSSTYKILDSLCFILLTLTMLIMMKTTYDWWWQRRTGRLPEFFKVNI